ncbi:MAG: VPLPA-CTERM sorting domain-containing protein [Pseudomonadota bacterium]
MRQILSCAVAAIVFAAGTASAATVSATQDLPDGPAVLTYAFTGLGPSVGDGVVNLSTGADEGVDLSKASESLTVAIDGTEIGTLAAITCTNSNSCPLDHDFTVLAAILSDALLDGMVDIVLTASAKVDLVRGPDPITVTLRYEDAISAVPLPAGLPLLAAGLAGFGVVSRRKARR